LAVDAASFAVSAWSLALLRPVGTVRIGQDTSFLAQLAAGWAEFRSRSWLWASVLHLSLLNLVVLAPFFVLGPLVALRSLGGPTAWAAIATAYASGAVAGGLVGLRWRPRRPLLAATLEITDLDRRQVAERRRGEAWFPDAFAALERIWSGDATAADWTAIAPFTYGRWDAVSQAHLAREASQKNAEAAAVYYSAGAIDPEATRTSLARLRAPVLVVAGEYDVALPPKCAAEYAGLFRQAELVVQPGGGHFPWLDDPEWFVQTLAGFLR